VAQSSEWLGEMHTATVSTQHVVVVCTRCWTWLLHSISGLWVGVAVD